MCGEDSPELEERKPQGKSSTYCVNTDTGLLGSWALGDRVFRCGVLCLGGDLAKGTAPLFKQQ